MRNRIFLKALLAFIAVIAVATLTLETDVRFASAEARAKFAEELTDAVARIAARYHDDRAPGGRRFRLLTAVHPVPAK